MHTQCVHVFCVLLTIYSDYFPVAAFPRPVFVVEIVLYGVGTECVAVMHMNFWPLKGLK